MNSYSLFKSLLPYKGRLLYYLCLACNIICLVPTVLRVVMSICTALSRQYQLNIKYISVIEGPHSYHLCQALKQEKNMQLSGEAPEGGDPYLSQQLLRSHSLFSAHIFRLLTPVLFHHSLPRVHTQQATTSCLRIFLSATAHSPSGFFLHGPLLSCMLFPSWHLCYSYLSQ